jgi:nucleoside-diphosphate-sugar epimerase
MTLATIDAPAVTVVTGAGGWLGTALMAHLTGAADSPTFADLPSRHGTVVRPLVRNRVEADRLRSMAAATGEVSVEPVIGDLTDPPSLMPLFSAAAGPVDVLHTAGLIHPAKRIAELFAVNAEGTRNLLGEAVAAGVRRLVHVSSNSPYGTNAHPDDRFRDVEPYHPYYAYGESKMQAEQAVLEAAGQGFDAVVVRPPWFYGPHQPPRQTQFFKMVRAGRFPVLGGGGQMRSMVYVDNLVQGVVRAELVATPPGRSWWIADAEPYSVTEIVETVGRALVDEGFSVKPNTLRLPDVVGQLAEKVDAALQRAGRYNQQFHVLGEMNKNIACTIDGARTELGYAPSMALYEGMRASIRWCVAQGLEL